MALPHWSVSGFVQQDHAVINFSVGKNSLTRSEVDMVESSSVLFQELVSILLGSESIKHIDLTNVLRKVPTISALQKDDLSSAPVGICEIIPPVVLLWGSAQTRCNSINLSGNAIGEIDAIELGRCRARHKCVGRQLTSDRPSIPEST